MIHETSVIEEGAVIGTDCNIGPYCVIGSHVVLGPRVTVDSHSVIRGHTTVGRDTKIGPFCAIGLQPEDPGYDGSYTSLVIGKNCILHSNVQIESGVNKTKVGDNCYFMTGSGVAHDSLIGNNVRFSPISGTHGLATVEDNVILSKGAVVHQTVRVGKGSFVSTDVYIRKNVFPYSFIDGNPPKLERANIVGMKRAGFSNDEITVINEAYKNGSAIELNKEFYEFCNNRGVYK